MKLNKPKSTAPDPMKYAISGSEDASQIALFMWAALPDNQIQYPDLKFMFAIPNGMFTPIKSVSGRMRAMGMKSGVPDMMLPVRRGMWPGLFIELKRKETETKAAGKTNANQNKFIDYLRQQGYAVIVCYGFEQARDTVIEYLNFKINEVPTLVPIKNITDKDMQEFDTGDWK